MPATTFVELDVASFTIGEAQTSARGARHAGMLARCGRTPCLRLPPGLRAPFGATSWQDEQTDRKNLDLTDIPEQCVSWLQTLDAWAVDAAFQNSERLFKKTLSREEVAGLYTPCLKPGKDDWPPTLRLKCNTAGSKALRCWERSEEPEDTALRRRAMPEGFRDARLEACVQVGYLWFQAKSFGLCLNISDLVVTESGTECPFN